MNYTTGGTGKGQGFPRSLVAVHRRRDRKRSRLPMSLVAVRGGLGGGGGGGGGGGQSGSEAQYFFDKAYENTEPISLSLLPHSSL